MKNLKLLAVVAILSLGFATCVGAMSQKESQVTSDKGELSVITIGTGTPKYSQTKANSSTAIKYKDTYYIIDCGDGSNANMQEAEFEYEKIGGIFFTHHHIDHTSDFFDLYAKCMLSGSENLNIVGPPRTGKFVDFVNDVYLDDILYRMSNLPKKFKKLNKGKLTDYATVKEVTGNKTIELEGLTVTTAEMTHTMYDLAYRFQADDKSIVVSGDTSYDKDLVTLSKGADILVIDGSLKTKSTDNKTIERKYMDPFYEYGGNFEVNPHLSFEDMIKIATEAGVKTLVITHYNDNNAPQSRIDASIAKIKESFDGEVIYATDMMEIGIDGTVIYEKKNEDTATTADQLQSEYTYAIVDTNQKEFYDHTSKVEEPSSGEAFYGQDATYDANKPSYTDNNDETITDNVTGLMWAKDMGQKMTYNEAITYAKECRLGGYDDWRIPSIKELYSLIQFNGRVQGQKASDTLFIDTKYFNQPLGDTSKGEREIDAQTWSSTHYVGKTMRNNETIFGVNFVDGRIKGYPKYNKRAGSDNKMYFRLVRGNTSYGKNNFVDNKDGTVTDLATGLTWQQNDSQKAMDWEGALEYAEELQLAGHDDWRLPNAKELQSIVDYNRSLQTTKSPAIDDVFKTSKIKAPDGSSNYPYFWTGTTHLDGRNPYSNAVYIAFGEALGEMNGSLMDVHGAGAQRSDPKSGLEKAYPSSFGPQGDIRYVYNYVRCVRTNK